MFYPVDSLKRGGRFYLCWVADSWPLRFATITHRQLWSQDVRKICDDLMEVMTNESGRPSNRFSLRLSSQLMRGLVRLYQKKVTIFLGDLCMINATVTRNVNKKWNIHDDTIREVVQRHLPQLPRESMIVEEPENERRIEELIQNSGNVVGNIQEITLRETTLPEIRIPVNDNFGEENPEQALLMLRDRTLELMLAADASTLHSGLELQLDATGDKSHDKSRAPHDAPTMEPITEGDVTLFRKSTERLTMGGLEKDALEISEIQLPDLSGPPPEKQVPEEPQVEIEMPIPEPPQLQKEPEASTSKDIEVVEFELEELESPPAKRRRVKHKRLIVDKNTKLSADYLITRIANHLVELRCEDSSDDTVQLLVPVNTYFTRPAHAHGRVNAEANIGLPLTRLFQRNLGVYQPQGIDKEMEESVVERARRVRTRSALERIEEEIEAEIAVADKTVAQIDQPVLELETTREALNVTEPNVEGPPNVTLPVDPEDIADLPTQKLETLSQTRKRTDEYELAPKRPRLMGYVSFRESQQMAVEMAPDDEADKENRSSAANVRAARDRASNPENIQTTPNRPSIQHANIQTAPARPSAEPIQPIPHESPEKSLTVMLQEVGLADLPKSDTQTRQGRPPSAEDSDTPLGSLDRTKVSLGDSDQTTESIRFIRDQWGTEGTMLKIIASVKKGDAPLDLARLVATGPLLAGHRRILVARCFASLLKLKQHGFLKIVKDPETLEIRDIRLGPKFDVGFF